MLILVNAPVTEILVRKLELCKSNKIKEKLFINFVQTNIMSDINNGIAELSKKEDYPYLQDVDWEQVRNLVGLKYYDDYQLKKTMQQSMIAHRQTIQKPSKPALEGELGQM